VTRACIWLDPGGTTGIATWDYDKVAFGSHQSDWQMTGTYIEKIAAWLGPELEIGYESYTITPGSHVKHDGSALLIIGMVRWLAYRHGATLLQSQQPSARKLGLLHLRKLGWYRAGTQHANDAAAHAAVYLMKTNQLPAELKERIAHDG